ncbi:MAG: glycosyltransferase family 2 protein [Pseudomonadota bacterium]
MAGISHKKPVIESVALCIIRNEQDIIEPFLRHTANLVDLIFVVDNCSTDSSREIISKCSRELGNIVATDLPDDGFNQSETMTRALQHVQSIALADFVLFLDADEFVSASSKQELRTVLRRLSPMTIGLMPWATYVPDPTLSEADYPDPLDRLTMRREKESPQFYKAVLRMAGGFDPGLKISMGNHFILDGKGLVLPSQVLDDLELIHFPLRSVDQLLAKGVIAWEANKRRTTYKAGSSECYQWKRLHDIAQRNQRPSAELLFQEALNYAQDAGFEGTATARGHGISIKRRFSDGGYARAEELIEQSKKPTSKMIPPLSLPEKSKWPGGKRAASEALSTDWFRNEEYLDEPPIRFLVERYSLGSVLDLGCGIGLYPALYAHLGVEDVLGVDRVEQEATILEAERYVRADFQRPFDVQRKFDLVTCLGVVQNIDRRGADILFDNIARHAKGQILFAMSEVGDQGSRHTKRGNIPEVLRHWAVRGWQPDLAASLGIRALSAVPWFRRNAVLLKNTGETGMTDEAETLGSIDDLDDDWIGQPSRHRSVAF